MNEPIPRREPISGLEQAMRAWIDLDDQGREYLTRVGSGIVLAVTPVGDLGVVALGHDDIDDAQQTPEFHRVAILVDAITGGSPAVRFQATAVVPSDSELLTLAQRAMADEESYGWTIQWHRHDYVPGDLPIESLDLANDARGFLVELAPVRELAHAVPDHVPATWDDRR